MAKREKSKVSNLTRIQPPRACKRSRPSQTTGSRTNALTRKRPKIQSSSQTDPSPSSAKSPRCRKQIKKPVTTDPEVGAKDGPSILSRTSSKMPPTGAKKDPQTTTPRKRSLQPKHTRRAGNRGHKPYSGDDSPSFPTELSSNEGRVDIGEPRYHRNVPSVKPSATLQGNTNKDTSTSAEAVQTTKTSSAVQKYPNLVMKNPLSEQTASESQNSPSITNPAILPSTSAPSAIASGQAATASRPSVYRDPFYKPAPPIPPGHKLVHLVRHCRAWHKYNSDLELKTDP